ncbi:MAG: outer membrane lipoprotein carrier protein LolA [Candidatus Aminicenantaceae bacterium]
MKKIFSLGLSSIFLLSLMISPGLCQKDDEILEKAIEALGGRKVLESIKDSTFTGTIEMIQMGITGLMTMYQKEPNKMRMDGEIMGVAITTAFDGETAWMVNPQTGNAEEMPEKSAEEFKRDCLGNHAFLYPEKYGITYTEKGTEKIEDKDYLVLEQTFSDGHIKLNYIDPKTYLIYKIIETSLNPMGVEVEAETFMTDYKKVDGAMIPYSHLVLHDGEEFMKINLTEVKFNTGLEDSMFRMSE